MKKSRKTQKKSRDNDPKKPYGSLSSRTTRESSNGPIWKNIAFGLIVCVAFFLSVEVILRTVGPAETKGAEDPFVGFSSIQPLFSEGNGNVTIAANRLRYFNEASFASRKPPNTFRIFAFGGSTTYGHPFNWQTAFPRWLQELLNSCQNGTRYEVINLGGISYASYRIIPLMKETLKYEPDLFIVYTGQNEFLERRSYSGLIDRNPILINAEALLEKLKLYRTLKYLLGQSGNPSTTQSRPNGESTSETPSKKTVLQDEANAILDRSSGLDLYHRDEEFSRGVIRHLAHNLNSMISFSRSNGVPLIFVTPASNLRDFSPFKSEHHASLAVRERSELDRVIEKADRLVKAGRFQDALSEMERIFPKVREHAQANFIMAKALDGLGRSDEARRHYLAARDLDVCPLRATSAVEKQIYDSANRNNAPMVDFKLYVENKTVESGIACGLAGEEMFLDHVHPNVELHQKLAELIALKMTELGILKNCDSLTPQQIANLFSQARNSLDKSLFVMRDLNLAKTLKWAGKKDEAKTALNRILEAEKDNPEVHKMLGAYALEEGQYKQAIDLYRKAVELSGDDPQLKLSLATAYYRSGDKQASKKIYETMVARNEVFPDILSNLSMLYLEENRVAEASDLLKKNLDAYPDSNLLYAPYGLALAMSGDLPQGIKWMKKASEAEPGDPSHLYNLAGMYALTNDNSNCYKYLNLAIDRGYSNSAKLNRDPVFQNVRNTSQFLKILERISE